MHVVCQSIEQLLHLMVSGCLLLYLLLSTGHRSRLLQYCLFPAGTTTVTNSAEAYVCQHSWAVLQ